MTSEIEPSAKALAYAALLNCGQVCTSTERVYVAENLFDDFTEALVFSEKTQGTDVLS